MKKRIIKQEFLAKERATINDYILNMKEKGYEKIFEKEFHSLIKDEDVIYMIFENNDIWTLSPMPVELENELIDCNTDAAVIDLGMTYAGRLDQYEGYELFNERHWVAYMVNEEDNTIMTATFFDKGNGYCKFASSDIYIKEIFDKNFNIEMEDLNAKTR